MLRRFTVDEYHRLIEVGILMSGEKVELLDGLLVRKPTLSPPMCFALQGTWQHLLPMLDSGWNLRIQGPITMARSEPEPDVSLVRGTDRTYIARHPGPDETGLVVEVTDNSLAIDRDIKILLYGEAGIPVYWLLDVVHNQVEVYTQTATGGYGPPLVLTPGQQLPLVLAGAHLGDIPVTDLFV